MLAFIPSPAADGIHLGPLFVHVYGLMYAIGIALAVRKGAPHPDISTVEKLAAVLRSAANYVDCDRVDDV